MEIPDYPPNNEASKRREAVQDKEIKRVTSDDPIRRKKSLGKQFKETFIGGDAKSAVRYAALDILLPAARDMIVESVSQGFEKLILGDSRRSRGTPPPQSGPSGYVTYNRYSMGSRMSSAQRVLSRQARSRFDFDEIVLQSRSEAEEVIDRLFEVVSQYGSATVADLYELVGIHGTHTDNKWGWQDLRGAGVSRVRGGYLLDLPEPQPLD
jgi:outer membrane protein OmpA-like peptidoglycan-associated protein